MLAVGVVDDLWARRLLDVEKGVNVVDVNTGVVDGVFVDGIEDGDAASSVANVEDILAG